ncbi:hypothetical protein EV207_1293 [Scopulibacillus darangshiensis]|uniref:Cell-wall binding lipoprotein n=1 Tax=Scopulibacillus darangshiensis TaxID=442528 RepID=A0A4V2SLJ9_9BACL|nr:hypothetical protein [Scopulibacillus darangshiensis]TCP23726.1 hypothetical protein EV207_1293 [Scopulibacillus darangshiensis]
MKRLIFSTTLLMLFLLSACSSKTADELVKYNNEDLQVINKETKQMYAMYQEFQTIDDPKKQFQYMDEKLLPLMKKMSKKTNDIQKNLETEDVRNLNAIMNKEFDTMVDLYEKQAGVLKLLIPPVSEEEQNQAEEIYKDVQKLSKKSDDMGEKYSDKLRDLADKYDVSKGLKPNSVPIPPQ